jgi:hypothetical protein
MSMNLLRETRPRVECVIGTTDRCVVLRRRTYSEIGSEVPDLDAQRRKAEPNADLKKHLMSTAFDGVEVDRSWAGVRGGLTLGRG